MAHRFDEQHLTVAREVNSTGKRRYLVWVTGDGLTTFVKTFEARDSADAKAQALIELQMVEAAMLRI